MPSKFPESHFLWPRSHTCRGLLSIPRLVKVSAIEEELRKMFPSGYPVLSSSGRAALSLSLINSGVSRNDFVGVFPYASHCVLDAVSRIATPLCGQNAALSPVRIVYHQWGYVQETKLPINTIEDCVDTLCIPGATLFPGGGRFEIWSLPKILGTTSGGVLWCRDEETAINLRVLRDGRGGGASQWLLRMIAAKHRKYYYYWQGTESNSGKVSRLQTGEIMKAIKKWDDAVIDRKEKLEIMKSMAIKWLPLDSDRLPSVVPIDFDQQEADVRELGLSAGYRFIEKVEVDGTRNLLRVLPVPIHQDVPRSWLDDLINKIAIKARQ